MWQSQNLSPGPCPPTTLPAAHIQSTNKPSWLFLLLFHSPKLEWSKHLTASRIFLNLPGLSSCFEMMWTALHELTPTSSWCFSSCPCPPTNRWRCWHLKSPWALLCPELPWLMIFPLLGDPLPHFFLQHLPELLTSSNSHSTTPLQIPLICRVPCCEPLGYFVSSTISSWNSLGHWEPFSLFGFGPF